MDLPKSWTTKLVALVMKIWLTSLAPRLGIGQCLGVANTCRVIGLDISVSQTRGNHTDLSKLNSLYKFNSKHSKVPEFQDI